MKKGLVILVSVYFIVSCSNGKKVDSNISPVNQLINTKATTELNFIGHWLYQAKREDLVREIANEYEFLNQNCKVNLSFPEDVYYSRSQADCEEQFVKNQLLSDHPKYDILRINDAYLKIAFAMNDLDWPKNIWLILRNIRNLINIRYQI